MRQVPQPPQLPLLVQHLAPVLFGPRRELELELIQTHMTQKPMLRVEVGARALRVLIKKMRLDGKGKCGCARHSCVGVDLWRAGQGGMGM